MKLKDKKIEILGKTYIHDEIGNSIAILASIASPVWAYVRQLSMKEIYGTVT